MSLLQLVKPYIPTAPSTALPPLSVSLTPNLHLDVFHGDVSSASVGDSPVGLSRASPLFFLPARRADRVLGFPRYFYA